MSDAPLVFDDLQPIEVRADEERIISTRLIPYGQTVQVRGRPESFAFGAVQGIDPTTIKLLWQHDRMNPIGRGVSIEERADGAYVDFRVSRTPRGDEALELARDGVLSMSPGFFPGIQNQQGVHQRLKALPEGSLVTFATYPGAEVLSVRDKEQAMPDVETPTTETPPETRADVDLIALETRMAEMSRTLDRVNTYLETPETRAAAVRPPSGVEWFAAQIESLGGKSMQRRTELAERWETFQTRALADITGGEVQAGDSSPADDLSGLVVEEFLASQLVNVLDRRRPLFASLGSFPMPRSGYAQIPTVTQHTLVEGRGAQKSEIPSRAMITTNASYVARWLAGGVDIALELILTAELPVLELVWNDLLGQYALATEHDATDGIVPQIEAGGLGFTYATSGALDTSSYAAFIADVEAQVDVIDDATGMPPDRLAVTRAQWSALVAMVDANDRRLFSTIGATNADAQVGLTARSFSLPGGIEVFKVKGLTQALLFNTESIRVADSGPQRVEATNVALMGRDLGILGRTMLIPRIPGGVVVFGTDPEI